MNQELNDVNSKTASKSFIQQRVERLYGPAALTQGLYSPKKPKSAEENLKSTTTTTTKSSISSVLVEKSQNSSNTFQSTKYVLEAQRNGHINNLTNDRKNHDDENINLNALNEALPVLRHLRPEFRAQLPALSPKRTIAITKLNSSPLQKASLTSIASVTTAQISYTNGTTNGKPIECRNISTNNVDSVSKEIANGVVSSNDKSNESTCQPPQQQQLHQVNELICENVSKLLASDAPSHDIIHKNGCLTSNKSHDIENDCRLTTQLETAIKDSNINTTNTETAIKVHLNDQKDANQLNIVTETNAKANNKLELKESVFNSKMSNNENSDVVQQSRDFQLNTDAINSTTKSTSNETFDANGNHKTEQKKDALYYLNTVQTERDRLIKLAIDMEVELELLIQVCEIHSNNLFFILIATTESDE